MKRKELLKILNNNGCILLRNGNNIHDVQVPNKETKQAIEDSKIGKLQSYNSVAEMMALLHKQG